MPDTEISKLPELISSQLQPADVLAIADVSAVETKKVRSDVLIQAGLAALPNNSIDPNKLNWSLLDSDSISGDDLADGSIADEKLIANTLTARVIAPNAIGASELADASVDTAAIQIGAVDNGALATNSVDDRVIQTGGVSNANLSAGSVTVDKLSLNDNDLPGSVIADGTITIEELEDNLPGSIIADGTLSGVKLNEGAISESKILGGAVTTTKVSDSAITDDKIASGINGAKITNSTVGPSKFTNDTFDRGVSNNGTNVGIINSVVPATTSGISWNSQGLVTGAVPLQGPDLPPSTDSTIGAISVPAGSGLTVSPLGAIDHLTLIAAGTRSGIEYDEHGHIRSTARLIGSDLPAASTTQIGGVSVPTAADNPLTVDAAGQLRHELTGFAAADGLASVNVDGFGHVTGGSLQLIPGQVPPLDASIINTGQFDNARIADDAITRNKLGDYSTSFIQEAQPSLDGVHIGMTWFQESTAQLRLWSGNSWQNVGFGRLAQENLRFCGTVDATTGLITTLTDNGRTAGFVIGSAVPSATDPLSGTYLVVEIAGANIGVVPATSFTAGDWCLCIDQGDGWIKIDATTGGGGSALLRLDDLLDVDINNPQAGDALFYDPNTNNWSNQTTETTAITINEAFDGARTSFTLQTIIDSVNSTILVLSGVLQQPGVDYNVVPGTTDLSFSSPPAAGSDYFMLSQTVQAGGGGGGGTALPPGTAENEYLQWNNALGAWAPSTELDGGSF